jgi:hypothetical protein
MNRIAACLVAVLSGIALLMSNAGFASAASELFAPPKAEEVQTRVLAWLNEQQTTEEVRQQVNSIWMGLDESASTDRLLELVIQSFALVDADVMKLVQACNAPPVGVTAPPAAIVNQPTRSPFFRANIGLFYGRYLVERRLFDESWDVLKSIDSRQVVDPASLFFFQAVAAQGMLELKPALDAIDKLTNTEHVPVRYSATAALMQADLKGLQEKSLGEIARLMADSERRLELGRAGEKVQGIQERIISNLDEIIKKIEQQQGGGGGGGGQGGNNNQPNGGASDSSIKGSESPGETDKKRFENKGTWGNLPEKDQAKTKNDLNKNFPSNYEQAIEKYTKKLATRAAKKTK